MVDVLGRRLCVRRNGRLVVGRVYLRACRRRPDLVVSRRNG